MGKIEEMETAQTEQSILDLKDRRILASSAVTISILHLKDSKLTINE